MNSRHIFDNADELCKTAADKIVELSNKAIADHGRFTIALSGGNTPRKLYEMLAIPPYHELINWKNVFFFWGDERCVPPTDKNNNSHMAFDALLNHIPAPVENIFPVQTELNPIGAASTYEQTLLNFFKEAIPSFDLILLGLGDNGHTASLFPNTSVLQEKKRIVKEVFISGLNSWRISFTATLINNASLILFLVTGKEKAAIVNTIFSGTENPENYPAQMIKSEKGNVEWYLDKSAASSIINS